jgi:N6-adenosine-specific RNA methylase IME4
MTTPGAADIDLTIPAFLDRGKQAQGVIADTGEVVSIGPRGLNLPGKVTQVGLELPDGLTFEEWNGIGECLQGVDRSLQWWIGDWLRFGESRYGEKYAQAVEVTGKDYDTVAAAKRVADRFEITRRRVNLSWSHHAEVAALPSEAADRLLDLAEGEGWSRNELRKRVNQAKASASMLASEPSDGTCTVADLHRLVAEGNRFGTIYADPPWLYDNQGTRASTGNHYSGLTVDQICALPVGELAADDAHLHLWTTNGFLFECPKILEAWGFEFRSTFVWIKPQIGIGNYWRNSHEFLLTAIRGDAKRFNDRSLKSWLECDRGAHSAKPEQVRSFIERASPGPFLELFGRRSAPGWAVWGNQIERSMFDRDVREVA